MYRSRRHKYLFGYHTFCDGVTGVYEVLAFNELDALQKTAFEFFSPALNDEQTNQLESYIYSCDEAEIYEYFLDRDISLSDPYLIKEWSE